MLQCPDRKAAQNIDQQDQDARNCVTPYKFTRTVHGAVKVRLAGDFITSPKCIVLTDQTRIQVSINRHLLAGHGIQGEAGCDL